MAISAADGGLLASLLGPRAEKTIPLPGYLGKPIEEGGKGASCVLYALGFDEIADAHMDARAWIAKKYNLDPHDVEIFAADILDLEKQVQVVFRACRDPQSPTTLQLAKYVTDVRRMPPDDIRWLHDQAIEWASENSEYTKVKLDELGKMVLEDVGKGGVPEIFWQRCDSVTLRSIARLLAKELGNSRLRISRLERSLDTSPPSNSSPTLIEPSESMA